MIKDFVYNIREHIKNEITEILGINPIDFTILKKYVELLEKLDNELDDTIIYLDTTTFTYKM